MEARIKMALAVTLLAMIFPTVHAGYIIDFPYNTLNNGLVGHWTFDGPDSNTTHVFDKSGNNNNGTINGSTFALGKIGQGMRFDGVDDYIDVANESNFDFERTDAFSIAAWVYRFNKDQASTIASKQQNSGNFPGWNFYATNDNDQLKAVFRGAASGEYISAVTGINDFSDSAWHHAVLIYNGSSAATGLHIYIDGVDKNVSYDGTLASSTLNNQNALIGHNPSAGDVHWNGLLDDVRIYNRALSEEEIKRLYNMGR